MISQNPAKILKKKLKKNTKKQEVVFENQLKKDENTARSV